MKNEHGFTLLEIIVALAILATGFLVVVQLFSGGVRLASASDRYLKGVSLAQHKFSELEMANFKTEQTAGVFEQDPDYRWLVDVEPYTSTLNNSDAGIQLWQVLLKVNWEEGRREHSVRLASLFTEGISYPAPDTVILGNVGNLGGGAGSATATSANGGSGPQSISGTGTPTSAAGPGLVEPPPGASAPAVDPNFQFDISGNPIGKPIGPPSLLGVTKGD